MQLNSSSYSPSETELSPEIDCVAIEEVRKEFINPPHDCAGDPCLPLERSWSGVSCTTENPFRVLSLNLTSHGLSGKLSQSIAKLTPLKHIWLGNNKLSCPLPDLSYQISNSFLQNKQLKFSVSAKRDGLSIRVA